MHMVFSSTDLGGLGVKLAHGPVDLRLKRVNIRPVELVLLLPF
jgi:hypothetical protein